jgi:hypothetical protein
VSLEQALEWLGKVKMRLNSEQEGIASPPGAPKCAWVKKDDLTDRSDRTAAWTRVDDYLGALLQRSRSRRSRREVPRTEPQDPKLLLSTLPFLLLIVALMLLVVAIAWLAWPGRERSRPPVSAKREIGTAAPGWLERSKKDRR